MYGNLTLTTARALALAVFVAGLLALPQLHAQLPPAGPAPAVEGQKPPAEEQGEKKKLTLLGLIKKGGPVMWPLGIASVIALAIAIERAISLRRSKVVPAGFVEGLTVFFQDGQRDMQSAEQYCSSHPSPLSNIYGTALKHFGRGAEHVEKALEDAGAREVERMKRSIRGLAIVASISPLLGLLGTVYGMIGAFERASAEGMGKAELLAEGIYQALVTTATGLSIAIPVLLIFQFFNSRIDGIVDVIDESGNEFLDHYLSEEGHKAA